MSFNTKVITDYQLSGPPMFSYFAVMDGDLLRKVFNDKIETDPTEEFYPERVSFVFYFFNHLIYFSY